MEESSTSQLHEVMHFQVQPFQESFQLSSQTMWQSIQVLYHLKKHKNNKANLQKKGLQYKHRCVLISSKKKLQVWYRDATEKRETRMIDKIDSATYIS